MIDAVFNWAYLGGLVAGIVGVGTLLVSVMNLRGHHESQTVSTQSVILGNMQVLNDELVEATERMRKDRDKLIEDVEKLRVERDRLQGELGLTTSKAESLVRMAASLQTEKEELEAQLSALARSKALLEEEVRALRTRTGGTP